PDAAFEDVEGVLDRGVVVPRHLLLRSDLEFGDSEAWPLGVPRPPLDLVEPARVLDALRGGRHLRRSSTSRPSWNRSRRRSGARSRPGAESSRTGSPSP